jgi:hypothetical protein
MNGTYLVVSDLGPRDAEELGFVLGMVFLEPLSVSPRLNPPISRTTTDKDGWMPSGLRCLWTEKKEIFPRSTA